MLILARYLRFALIIIAAIVMTAIGLSNSQIAARASGLPDFDYRLGLSLAGDGNVDMGDVQPLVNGGYKYVGQGVDITTPYGMGYRLMVESNEAGLAGSNGQIRPVSDTAGESGLPDNSWGLTFKRFGEPVDVNKASWFNPETEHVAMTSNEIGGPANISTTAVYYGVNAGWETRAGGYEAAVSYTLLPEVPSTPVVAEVKSASHAIGSGDLTTVYLRGLNLAMIKRIGVDLNGDRRIDDDELCGNYLVDEAIYAASCQMPEHDVEGDFNILISSSLDGNDIHSLAYQYGYYYRIRLNPLQTITMENKKQLRLSKAVTDGGASLILSSDGDIYQRGYGDWISNGNQYNNVVGAGLVNFSGRSANDPIIDVAAQAGGKLAVTQSGKLYHWGANNTGRSGWPRTVGPTVDSWRPAEADGAIRAVALGPDFAVAVTDYGTMVSMAGAIIEPASWVRSLTVWLKLQPRSQSVTET